MPGEPSSINAQIFIPGQEGRRRYGKQLTLEMISEWIRLQGFDDYTTNGLIELASKYPTQALPQFRRNFNLMISRVRANRKAELGGEEKEIEEVVTVVNDPWEDAEASSFVEVIEEPKPTEEIEDVEI